MGSVSSRVKVGVLCVILFVAVLLRVTQFSKVPESLYWDEIAMLIDARSIAQTGLDIHSRSWLQPLFPSYGDYKLPVYIWFTALGVRLFGVHEWVVRVPSVLAGLGTVVLLGFFVQEVLHILSDKLLVQKKKSHAATAKFSAWCVGSGRWLIAACVMAVVALSPWSIGFSRTGFEGHLAQFLVLSSIFITLKLRKFWWSGVPAALLGGLATYTYFSVRFVWPVLFILSVLFLVVRAVKMDTKLLLKSVVQCVVGIGLFWLLLQPMMHDGLYNISNFYRLSTPSVLNSTDYAIKSNEYREIAGNTIFDRVFFHRHWLLLRELGKNVSIMVSPEYLFVSGDQNLRHGTGQHGLFLLPLAVVLPVGIVVAWLLEPFLLLLLLSWWAVGILPAAVPLTVPHALRSLNALVPLSIFLGLGLSTSMYMVWQLKNKYLKFGIVLFYGGMCVFALLQFVMYYFFVYPTTSLSSWQAGHRELAQALLREKGAVEQVLIEPFDQRFYLWLFLEGYTAKQVQSFPSRSFQHHEFDGFLSDPLEWEKLATVSKKTMVVGLKTYAEGELSKHNLKPTKGIVVPTPGGEYLLSIFEPKL